MSLRAGRRKLIEVALPLVEISEASLADKHRKVGTLKNFHKWFAPMPTPALRALIFAALVDDPDDPAERAELVEFVKELVPRNGLAPSEGTLRKARELIKRSNPEPPVVLDPFVGGGSTLVETLRLGLTGACSDLNPVAALVTRTLGVLLPEMAGLPAISGESDGKSHLLAYDGFAADLRHYGAIVQEAVKKRIGHLYPVPDGGDPVAWLWARTVPCVNPECAVRVPLFGSPWLSKQKGREATVEAQVEGDEIRFIVHRGKDGPAKSTKGSGRAQFACPACHTPINERQLRDAGKEQELGLQLMAYCHDVDRVGRTFLASDEVPEQPIDVSAPEDLDEMEIGGNTKNFAPPLYGFERQEDLYTPRQLVMLMAFADEIGGGNGETENIHERVIRDGGSVAQARTIATVLGICLSKMVQANSSLIRWFIDPRNGAPKAVQAFGTQAMPMLWDFAECYPFGESVGSWDAQIKSVIGLLKVVPPGPAGSRVAQEDARRAGELVEPGSALIVTDPPYFAQINYADLSDYFYLWLRQALQNVHPDLFGTIATPKAVELVANSDRHGGDKDKARTYFIEGFTETFRSLQTASRPDLPIVVAYASKQDDKKADTATSTSWVALLEAVLESGLGVVSTLPIECTHRTRQVSQSTNALASYIILACRPRTNGDVTDRTAFLSRLREEMPDAIEKLRKGGIPPQDMGQAAIGPGMKIFSEYHQVLEPSGDPMTVRDALLEIDKTARSIIHGDEEYDPVTSFCLTWFREFAFDRGPYGEADKHLRTTGTTIRELVAAGIATNVDGQVQLRGFKELPDGYNPAADERISHWELAMHLAKAFESKQGIDGAARLVALTRSRTDNAVGLDRINRLIHGIFNISEHRYRETARIFNGLGAAWSDILTASESVSVERYVEGDLLALAESYDDDE